MKENQQSPFLAVLSPARDRAVRAYGRIFGFTKGTGSKIKETTQRLIPGFPRPLPTVQRANRAAASDLHGFSGFTGSNEGWARTEYGEYYATSVAGTQTPGTK